MEPKDSLVWRVVGANVAAWIGGAIGSAVAPEFGGDAYSSIVASQSTMVGAFLGALLGGGMGWLTDRWVGNGRRDLWYSHQVLIREQRTREQNQ